jgi:predicted alternative tryptophan synthase beta-subunit
MADNIKYLLEESRIPQSWYNLMADLPAMALAGLPSVP